MIEYFGYLLHEAPAFFAAEVREGWVSVASQLLLGLLVLGGPALLVARRYGVRGAVILLGAPLLLGAVSQPAGKIAFAIWPDRDFFAYGMATVIYFGVLATWLPFAIVGALLGLWWRRARGMPANAKR